MGLAEYFHRSAIAAAQALCGYDEEAIRERLENHVVLVAGDTPSAESPEGEALLDMTIRVVARLYPQIALDVPGGHWADLARTINPAIEIGRGDPTVAVVVGDVPRPAPTTIYAGSEGWLGRVSTADRVSVAHSRNPCGPGIAACLATANVFRHVFHQGPLDDEAALNGLVDECDAGAVDIAPIAEPFVLVGLGAIGNAAAWALGRFGVGECHLVDHETVELGNLQRYVLATPEDVGRNKTDVGRAALGESSATYPVSWDEFVEANGYGWDRVLVAVDSAAARHAVQASLPRWLANGWTQPGDLGVSVHPWTEDGACLSCLYLPKGPMPNEDELVARALGLSHEQHGLAIRTLLHTDGAPPPELLDEVSKSLGVDRAHLAAYANRPIRQLYVEGICGGAVLSLARAGRPEQNVHVPLAHQSALAGILLAARFAAACAGHEYSTTLATRVDMTRPIGRFLTQPVKKDQRGICVCGDPDYRRAWDEKYGGEEPAL